MEPIVHFVGRETEVRLALNLLHARSPRGSALFYRGERGSGKSRLLNELESRFRGIASVSLAPAREPKLNWSTRVAMLAREVPPRVLVVDDLDMRPEMATNLSDSLQAAAGFGIHVVGSFARESGRDASRLAGLVWEARLNSRVHSLEPLADASIELIIRSEAANRGIRISDRTMRAMIRICSGNPRYVQELLEDPHQLENHDLVPASARATADALKATTEGFDFELLRTASVIGSVFRDIWLLQLGERDECAIACSLQHAVDRSILVEEPRSEGTFRFRDPAVRQALYMSLTSTRRRLLHRQVAELFCKSKKGMVDGALVAQHWTGACEPRNARLWFLRSANEFAADNKHSGAGIACAEVAQLSKKGCAAWIDATARAADYFDRAGEFASAVPLRESILSVIPEGTNLQRRNRTLAELVHSYRYVGEPARAGEAFASLRSSATPKDARLLAVATIVHAEHLSTMGRERMASEILSQVDLNAFEDEWTRKRFAAVQAMVGHRQRPIEDTLPIFDAAAASAAAEGAIFNATIAVINAADLASGLGELDLAVERAERAVALTQMLPTLSQARIVAVLMRCELHILSGEVTAAKQAFVSTVGMHDFGAFVESYASALGVTIGMHIGDASLVDSMFNDKRLLAAIRAHEVALAGLLFQAFVPVMLARGNSEQLRSALDTCIADDIIDKYFTIPILAARNGSESILALARQRIEERRSPYDRGVVEAAILLFDGICAGRAGRMQQARRACRAAAQVYASLKWGLYEAFACEMSGNAAGASALYLRCGAIADVARLGANKSWKAKRAPFAATLTTREMEVAHLVALGWSNDAIAARLDIGRRTVHSHVAAVFGKLGIRARWQLDGDLLRERGVPVEAS